MSHVSDVQLHIKDLAALKAACTALGLELVEGQQTYKWFGTHVGDYPLPKGFSKDELGKCAHAIRVKPGTEGTSNKTYEIGVVSRKDGQPGFTLMWDFWCGGYGLQQVVGDDCNKLKQAYAVQVAARRLQSQGMRVQQVVGTDGTVRLVASK